MKWFDASGPSAGQRTPEGSPSSCSAAPERFYGKVQQILEGWRFDALVQSLCARFYADVTEFDAVLLPQTYFRLLLIGWMEGIVEGDGGIVRRIESSDVLRRFVGGGRPAGVPAADQVARTRALIDRAMHEEVFHWVLTALDDCATADVTEPVGAILNDTYLPWVRLVGLP